MEGQAIRVPCRRGARLDFAWGAGTQLNLCEVVEPQPGGGGQGGQQQQQQQQQQQHGDQQPIKSSVSWCVRVWACKPACMHARTHTHARLLVPPVATPWP